MTGIHPSALPPSGLKRNYLSFFEVISQSIGTVAPSMVPGMLLPVLFGLSGNATTAVIAFCAVGILFFTVQLRVFAQRVASPGALYVYTAEGLGPFAGIIGGWSDIIAYTVGTASALAAFVNVICVLMHQVTGYEATIPIQIILCCAAIFVPAWFAWRDVKLSARMTIIIELILLGLVFYLLGLHFIRKGSIGDLTQLDFRHFTFAQFEAGLVLGFLSFPGFEMAAALGSEARQPLKTIPRSLIASVLFLAFYFLITSYGLIDAFQGVKPSLDQQNAPLTALAQLLGSNTLGTLIAAGLCLSVFAGVLGGVTAGSRVLYSLSHRGLFHASAQKAHPKNATPHIAILFVAGAALIPVIVLTLCDVPLLDSFGYLGAITSFGFLFSYILVSISAPVYLKRLGELRRRHIVSAAISVLVLTVPLIGSVYPMPDWPMNILPYIFLGLLGIGTSYFLYVKKIDPERLQSVEAELIKER